MKNLSPEAQQLVRSGREALRPSKADRERNFDALRARLGDAALYPTLAGPALTPSAGRGLWSTISAVTVGLAVVGGAFFFALRREHRPVIYAASASVQTSARTPTSSQEPPRITAAGTSPSPLPAPAPAASAQSDDAPTGLSKAAPREPLAASARSRDRLAEEVEMLARATSALRAGRAAVALRALDEHQSKFPNGVLTEERRAARAQSLCALGRRGEADVELARLARSSPHSPQAARARQMCER